MSKEKQVFRTAYGEGIKMPFYTEGESLTQQHFREECDIKTIIKKHDRTGIIQHVARGVAQYGDYSEVHEYREALDLINAADESFAGLPADVRKAFNNDAGEFFEFATNPDNAEAMVELGLAPSPAPAESKSGNEAKASKKAAAEPVDLDVSEG
jgi:phage internal scaffolding protein